MASAVNVFSLHSQFCKLCEQRLLNPQVLSCLHVVCEQCLMYLLYAAQGTSYKDYSIVCPDCKKTVTVGLSGAGNPMLPPSNSSTTLFECSSCVKETNSVFRCQYCSKIFCLSCFRGHSYVSCVSNVKGTKRYKKCTVHNMELKHYCVDCQQPACVFCLTNKHRGDNHKQISIFEAEKDVRSHMEKLLNTAKEHTNQCYGTISCLLEVLTNLRSKHDSAKDELEATFQSFMKLCEKHYTDASKDINAIYSQEEMKVKKLLHDIEDFGAQIGESSKMAKRVLMEADITALLKFRAFIPDQLSEARITPHSEVKALLDADVSKSVDKTFQFVLNDFHEKMIFTNEGFMTFFNTKLTENPKKPVDKSMPSSSKSVNFDSNFRNKGNRMSIPCHHNYEQLTIKFKFGSIGIQEGEFNNPSGFCLGANDDIIIVDTFNHRIQIFDKNGIFKFKFGVPGKQEGNLWFPTKVAVLGHNNRFLICDQGIERARLQIFSPDGNFIRKISFFDAAIPSALAVTNEGYIFIVDKQVPFVYMINESGELIRCFDVSNYVVEPSDIAVYDCELFICDFKAHCVAVFTTAGVFRRYIGNKDVCSYPNGIYVTNTDVLVCDSNNTRFHIARFTRSGLFKESYMCMQLKVSRCCGLQLNSDGDVLTVSRGHHTMFVMNNMLTERKK